MTGTCKYCGQTMMVVGIDDEETANRIATEQCKCPEGMDYRNIEQMKDEAKANAEALFKIDDLPFPDEKAEMKNLALLDLMDKIIDNLAAGTVKKVSLKLDERTTATMVITKSDGITIKKNYKEEFSLEANKY